MANQAILQPETLIFPEMRLSKFEKAQHRGHWDKSQKSEKPRKLTKLQPKEQLKVLQKQRIKQTFKHNRHAKHQDLEYRVLPSSIRTSDELNACLRECVSQQENLIVRPKLLVDRIVPQMPQEATSIQSTIVHAEALEPSSIIDKQQVILIPDPNIKLSEAEQITQQAIIPQEVVLVSYNGPEVPSESGIIAYDDNGQILLIHESDIKTADNCKSQQLIQTYDGATFIIDSNPEAAAIAPTYIVWDKDSGTSSSLVIDGVNIANVVVTDDGTTLVTEDPSANGYGFQDWDDFEIYQAMTSFRIAETSETNSVLTQPPIMSTVEIPSSVEPSLVDYKFNRKMTEPTYQSIEDSLAQIGVIASEASNIPPTLQLPATVTDPTITSTILSVANVEEEENSTIIGTSSEYWQ